MDIILIGAIIALVAATSLYWGTWLAQNLPEIDPWFDQKPFNCRPCLTFHLVWVMMLFVAICVSQLWLAIAGFVLAIVLYLIVKHVDNKNIIR